MVSSEGFPNDRPSILGEPLSRKRQEEPGGRNAIQPEESSMGGTETVLFVDDEPTLRSLGQAILERQGYEVLEAEDGIEALEIFREQRERIDLVILDLTMPRLSGQETLSALRAIDPHVMVLFASGYSPEQLSPEERAHIAGFVAKPYRPQELQAIVCEALDRRAALAEPPG